MYINNKVLVGKNENGEFGILLDKANRHGLITGASGSGKTTSLRNLNYKEAFYIDADGKGLSWKGWRKQYCKENKNY